MLKPCLKFYKLAVDNAATEKHRLEVYQHELSNPKLSHRDELEQFVSRWQDESCFKVEDIMPLISSHFETLEQGINFWQELAHYIHNPDVSRQILDKIISSRYEDIGWYQYLKIEILKDEISPEVFDKCQRVIILEIMRAIKEINENNDDDKVLERYLNHLKEMILMVFRKTRYLPKSLIETLFKRLGPDYYAENFFQYKWKDPDSLFMTKLLTKDKIDQYDIAMLKKFLEQFQFRFLLPEEFNTIIQKATPAAKEYMRRFLYGLYPNNHGRYYFILSEDMTPMNEKYQTVGLPHQISLHYLSELRSKATGSDIDLFQRWSEIFTEFNIVPL